MEEEETFTPLENCLVQALPDQLHAVDSKDV